ncbi:MAG: hypothetical protein KA419_00270 [Acidobacteria bacterium]|nr:hypothetical protein [Acidobacteriota bacterium]
MRVRFSLPRRVVWVLCPVLAAISIEGMAPLIVAWKRPEQVKMPDQGELPFLSFRPWSAVPFSDTSVNRTCPNGTDIFVNSSLPGLASSACQTKG